MADQAQNTDRQSAPYDVARQVRQLREKGEKPSAEQLQRLAVTSPDRAALADALQGKDAPTPFYPESQQPATPETIDAIDRFLDNFGNTTEREVEAINNAIFNPMPDYADVLAAQEQAENAPSPQAADEQDRIIDSFIKHSQEVERAQQPLSPEMTLDENELAEIAAENIDAPQDDDEGMLSESLAKIYISQGKYAPALEIIEKLFVNYPQKSIYFADQIRFLRKLNLNRQRITKN